LIGIAVIFAEGVCQADPPGTIRLFVPPDAPDVYLAAITDNFYREYNVLPQVCGTTGREYYLIPGKMPLFRLDLSGRLALRSHDDILANPTHYLTNAPRGTTVVGSYWGLGGPNGALYSLGYETDTGKVWGHAKMFVHRADQVVRLGSEHGELILDPFPLGDEYKPPSVMVVDHSGNLQELPEFRNRNQPYFISQGASTDPSFLAPTHSLPSTEREARSPAWLRRIGALSQQELSEELLTVNKPAKVSKFGGGRGPLGGGSFRPKAFIPLDPENFIAGAAEQAVVCGDERVIGIQSRLEKIREATWGVTKYAPTNWMPYLAKQGAAKLDGAIGYHVQRYRERFGEPSGTEGMLNRFKALKDLMGGEAGKMFYMLNFASPCAPKTFRTYGEMLEDRDAT
jgi:hypothetical protein